MPDLLHSLQARDLGHLRIVAELWGVELQSNDASEALKELSAALRNPVLAYEIMDSLPAEAKSALETLAEAGGKVPWAAFARQFGELRDAGPGRRDREQLHLHPISAAETLFYRALLARAFFDTPSGLQEFAYIPDDLLPLTHHREHEEHRENTRKDSVDLSSPKGTVLSVVKNEPLGRPATPKERAHVIPSSDRILDDATTLLAALRLGIEPPKLRVPLNVLTALLSAGGLISRSDLTPHPPSLTPFGGASRGKGAQGDRSIYPEAVKSFLEAPRAEALALLAKAWQNSETFNELRQIPELVCEGEWRNPSHVTRHTLLAYLAAIPHGQWWSLPAFIRAIKEKHPDFQRPAGDYDSWFIKREADGVYLRGFEHWDEVDGALIRYFITGPLFWLGMAELASPESDAAPAAFRSTLHPPHPTEDGKLTAASNGVISVPRLVPRAARYQISRFCEWEESKSDEYRYRVTPASLTRARQQKLKPDQLLAILRKHAAAPLPPPFVRAIQRWEINGTEARLEHPVVLRLASPAILDELRKSKAARFLGETLGPTAVIVKPGAQSKVLAALAELGLLAEDGSTQQHEDHTKE